MAVSFSFFFFWLCSFAVGVGVSCWRVGMLAWRAGGGGSIPCIKAKSFSQSGDFFLAEQWRICIYTYRFR